MNKRTRRGVSAVLALLLLASFLFLPASGIFHVRRDPGKAPESAGREPCVGMDAFRPPESPAPCGFRDVSEDDWFHDSVAYARSIGLIRGLTEAEFAPNRAMTVASCLALAVRVYEAYHGITPELPGGEHWYDDDVRRAGEYGILPAGCENFEDPVRRDQAAAIFCQMLPREELSPRNEVEWIPDLQPGAPYYEQILTLYRAGVLGGVDDLGFFRPDRPATRAELVTILCAAVNPAMRRSVRLLRGDLSVFRERAQQETPYGFTDVGAEDRCAREIGIQQRLGIMDGVGSGRFSPNASVTLAQALKVCVAVFAQYHGISLRETEQPWDDCAVQRALVCGILTTPLPDYDRPATRGEILRLLSRCLRAEDLAPINEVDELPDVPPASEDHDSALQLVRAGVLRGSDESGAVDPELCVTRAELAALLTRLLLPEERLRFTPDPEAVVTFHYGVSGSGRFLLTGYRLGHGANVLVLSFAIHGWEDSWQRDGRALVELADATKAYLEARPELLRDGDWTVYILRCLNPDGLYLGSTHDGPGRCTTTRLGENGELLTDTGIDMNRCFPHLFRSFGSPRNFNGTQPLQCVEARQLAKFIRQLPDAEKRVSIDVHGWYGEILTTSGKGPLYKSLHAQFPEMPQVRIVGGSGYLAAWMGYELGYDSALLELPSSIRSHNGFLRSRCTERFTAAIADLLAHYAPAIPRPVTPEEESRLR